MKYPAPAPDEWHRLFNAALNGTLTEAEKPQLAAVLKSSQEARELWFFYQDNEIGFGEIKPRHAAPAVAGVVPGPARSAWLQWRPLMAAAAGLVIGLFSASLVWGYAGAYAGRTSTLLREGFESGPPPKVTGLPLVPGHWSGDYSEVVGEYRGVTPANGAKMLRFVRADYEGKPRRDGYIADLFRLIDLNGPELDVLRGDARVSLEARFRSLPQAGAGRIRCSVTLHALDALPSREEIHEFYLKPRDGVAAPGENRSVSGANILASVTRQEVVDSVSGAWHLARTELLVPPGTRYLLIHLHEWELDSQGPHAPQPVTFDGIFVDDVRVTLTHRPLLP